MKLLAALIGTCILVLCPSASARTDHGHQPGARGLANATVLIVRHAEKDEGGPGLSPAGSRRARAYAEYFRPFSLDGRAVRVDALVATQDSRESRRPRLTLEPLSEASGLAIEQPFKDRDVRDLVRWLGQGAPGRTILIAWHHGKIPKLIHDFGLDPAALLPGGKWPPDVYAWVLLLRFDRNGVIRPGECRLIREPSPLPS